MFGFAALGQVALGQLLPAHEPWLPRAVPSGLWTTEIADSGITITQNAHFTFGALGAVALGQGIYSPKLYSETWQGRPLTGTWAAKPPEATS